MNWYIIYLIILTMAILTGFFRFQVITASNKCFLLLVLITFITEIIARQVALSGASNFLVYHIFTPIQCSIAFLGFYFDTKARAILYTIPLMLILGLILSIWVQPLPSFNTYYMSIELFFFTFLSIVFFRRLLVVETEIKLRDFPLFWISCGLLIFSVTNLFDLGTMNFFLLSNTTLDKILTYARYFTNYILYSSFIVAFLVKQNTISDQHGK